MADPWASERLYYRKIEPDDEKFISTIYEDASTTINASPYTPTPRSSADCHAYIKHMEACLLGVAVCLKEWKIPIGVITLNAVDERLRHHGSTSLGVKVMRQYQNQGFGSEAIQWTLQWAFCFNNLHRIELDAFEHNEGAQRLYERLGFRKEGIRKEVVYCNGKYWDVIEFAALQREWVLDSRRLKGAEANRAK